MRRHQLFTLQSILQSRPHLGKFVDWDSYEKDDELLELKNNWHALEKAQKTLRETAQDISI